ncbi:FkbM family methyltransferase [Streptomyces tailanensis]|uniref:FkbM family methyltransferase n=1 Tax=Streptomyces tailanensis TaxID=2569858 RepID=UPI00122E4E6F|nr:FkbM family methyltransferase [Streptomyces tailanensis]
MAHLARRIKLKTAETVVPRLTRVHPDGNLERLGSDYGGWWVPTDLIAEDSVVYAAGVGEDASFDLALIKRFGCEVWAIDPTPRALEYAGRITDSRWHFLPFGLWKEDAVMHFHPPVDTAHVSHSVTEVRGSGPGFDAQCYSLASLTQKLGHQRVDLLKMDIEGAEGPVLDQLLMAEILPGAICVEFDAPESPWALRRRLSRLEKAGYVVRWIEARNYTLALR